MSVLYCVCLRVWLRLRFSGVITGDWENISHQTEQIGCVVESSQFSLSVCVFYVCVWNISSESFVMAPPDLHVTLVSLPLFNPKILSENRSCAAFCSKAF